MTPERSTSINGRRIDEFYWHGEMVVYIDHRATEESYDDAVARLQEEGLAEAAKGDAEAQT